MMMNETYDVEDQKRSPLISGDVREVTAHIKEVYLHLTGLLMMAVMGCLLQMKSGVMNMGAPFLGALACLGYVYCGSNQSLRVTMFLTFGFLDGWMVGPLITILQAPPSTVLTALVLTTILFLCFTLSAMYAKRRSYLYLGAILSSCIIGLLVVSVVSIFLQWKFLWAIQIYGGLVVFSLYVAYDTQVMIERANNGLRDPLYDAIDLFIDFMAIFKRLLIILSDRSD
eukprot:TRINITY_DN1479_c0_g1_i1.p1 TRINITY_DN1479_c0_g1~~TRINITY_DN1479_c0_g1_i1.p1  ORF type:complete len:255 (+),score=55.55 TRINITY_DN1479_c0_g1_i1:86-766(+)